MRWSIICTSFLVACSAFQPASRRGDTIASSRSLSAPGPDTTTKTAAWSQHLAASVVLPSLLVYTIAVAPALALDTSSVFNHEYADPFHPLCERKIQVSADGQTFHFSGTGVGSPADDAKPLYGCSSQEIKLYSLRQSEFDGQILAGGSRLSVGDGIHEGVWEPKNTATTQLGFEDVDGIRWNDGNKWVVKSQSYVSKNAQGKYEVTTEKPLQVAVGEWIFYSYIGFSTLAGFKGAFDTWKRKQQDT